MGFPSGLGNLNWTQAKGSSWGSGGRAKKEAENKAGKEWLTKTFFHEGVSVHLDQRGTPQTYSVAPPHRRADLSSEQGTVERTLWEDLVGKLCLIHTLTLDSDIVWPI